MKRVKLLRWLGHFSADHMRTAEKGACKPAEEYLTRLTCLACSAALRHVEVCFISISAHVSSLSRYSISEAYIIYKGLCTPLPVHFPPDRRHDDIFRCIPLLRIIMPFIICKTCVTLTAGFSYEDCHGKFHTCVQNYHKW